ncbi:Transglutaminase-like superfamily protein [Pirellulimonas nuda]|uniref:Transglutaminase-like superfamily protein n=1 Tax=Pirellulimonas nuda TaxID=2528009 RepID=A0A518DES0_9BACT|nr:transglutaminase domain-containing protein [Pirellulimonas nuda]QDU89966.1 Transglutaminase-like superfamily protein [Pirellulimonas nuda]
MFFALLVTLVARDAPAQLAEADAGASAVQYGEPRAGRFRVGAEITASRGACRAIRAMVAVPLECPEQSVRIVKEEFSPDVESVSYRDLQGGARQMLITVPRLADGATATAVVTFEVVTRPILPPSDAVTAGLKIPRSTPRDLRKYVTVSPFIQSRDSKFRSWSRELLAGLTDEASDWQRVEAFYDAMLEKIEYAEGVDKSALETLRDGQADCFGRSAVFIALCRAAGVPARAVWVQDHCYAEFYLEDEEGEGAWFPAESAGTRAFGEMPLARTIMQKGDNFRIPERPKDRLFYATDFLVGLPMPGSGKPSVKYIREPVN